MKKLQDILDHVDPSEIADICQAGDSRTEKRLYSRIEMHLQNPEEELLVPAQEHTHGIAWQRIVMTAACLTIVGGAGTAAVLLSHPQHVSQGSQEAAEQTTTATVAAEEQTAAQADRAEEQTAEQADRNDEEPAETTDTQPMRIPVIESGMAEDPVAETTDTTEPPATTAAARQQGTGTFRPETTTAPRRTTAAVGTTTSGTTAANQTTTVTTSPDPINRQIDELTRKGNEVNGFYKRAISILNGSLPADQARLTVETAKEIIMRREAEKTEYTAVRIYQDFIDIAGVYDLMFYDREQYQFWIDDSGENYIEYSTTDDRTRITYVSQNQVQSVLYQTSPEPTTLPDDQQTALEELERKGDAIYGIYMRGIMQIKGELPVDQPRLTLEQAKQIIEEERMKEGFVTESCRYRFNEIAGAPDVMYGSGIDHEVYWLDDTGKEYIEIIPQWQYGDIIYFRCESGFEDSLLNSVKPEYEYLYTNH